MVQTAEDITVRELPLAPLNPLPYRQQVRAIRTFHAGVETLRNVGGPVTRLRLGPQWLMPAVVVASSPQAARDILGHSGERADRARVHHETRNLFGPSLFDLAHEPWLPRRRTLQPIFTKQHVREFGGHMAQAAQSVIGDWADGTQIDLDTECRRLTLRALGRSVLGLDLDEHADTLAAPVRNALEYVADRALRPLRAPRWLPTPARRRACAASGDLHRLAGEILWSCRADPTREAPLVHALIAARDPATGRALSDDEIRTELVSFMVAGHDTTATTLAYALWALGHHPEMQDKVRAEAVRIGDRELTPDDASDLRYTVQVLHEALRLCPPAAATTRTALCDFEVGGYRVEAGTMLVVGIYALHRDPALWEHPPIFDPDRFNPQNSAGRDRWQYLPFGAGPRSCIGDHFAMLEATLALATIVRGIQIRSSDPEFPMIVPFTTIAAAPIRAEVKVINER
ncbi:Unspecific monooxygenase [Mycolicibacterium rhodesiae JS60]|nr:Unspecific monooxygenase [Mycolicibacterium rhodesiae JS60]